MADERSPPRNEAFKLKVRRAYDPDGRKLTMLRPEERVPGGVDFYNTAGGVITMDDVPEGASKEAILQAIKERRRARQRHRDKNPDSVGAGSKRMFRRDI